MTSQGENWSLAHILFSVLPNSSHGELQEQIASGGGLAGARAGRSGRGGAVFRVSPLRGLSEFGGGGWVRDRGLVGSGSRATCRQQLAQQDEITFAPDSTAPVEGVVSRRAAPRRRPHSPHSPHSPRPRSRFHLTRHCPPTTACPPPPLNRHRPKTAQKH